MPGLHKRDVPRLIPGDTHSALLAAGKIPDPYAGANELEVQWVGREDWIYERDFEVTESILRETAVFLECEYLDTVEEHLYLRPRCLGVLQNSFAPLLAGIRGGLIRYDGIPRVSLCRRFLRFHCLCIFA